MSFDLCCLVLLCYRFNQFHPVIIDFIELFLLNVWRSLFLFVALWIKIIIIMLKKKEEKFDQSHIDQFLYV